MAGTASCVDNVRVRRIINAMDGLPPPRFDHSYHGPLVEWVMPWREVERICKGLRAVGTPDLEACTLYFPNFPGDKCYIVLPKIGIGGTSKRIQSVLRRHEVGHCNGWPASHPT